MSDLTVQQIATLERLRTRGFQFVAFPMYANYVGAKKGNCAALLAPVEATGFKIFGEAACLVSGNLSVRITRGGREWFVWKRESCNGLAAWLAGIRPK